MPADRKFGLYLSNGNNTCQGRAGSWGYEDQDAQYLARLKVDYLKCKSRQTISMFGSNLGRFRVWRVCEFQPSLGPSERALSWF